MKRTVNKTLHLNIADYQKRFTEKYGSRKDLYLRYKKSFLCAFLKALALISILIYLIFAIKPGQAYIHAKLSDLDIYNTSLTAGSIVIKSPDLLEISFSSVDPIRINLKNSEIEECRISDPYYQWLAIYPEDPEESIRCNITGQKKEIRLYNTHTDNMQIHILDHSECCFIGPQHITITNGKCFLEQSSGEKNYAIDSNISTLTIIERENISSLPIFPMYSPDYVDLSNPVKSYKAIIENFSPTKSPSNKHILLANIISNDRLISVSDIKYFKSRISGDIEFSYVPTPNEYHIISQELKLENTLKPYPELQLEYTNDESSEPTGYISGYVTNGELSKMSLFPTFTTWFYSNAYMTPTAIITIVISAIALFIKKQDKKEE